MADSKNDITTNVEASEEDILQMKKAQIASNPNTRMPRPAQVAETPQGLNPELLQRLRMGQKTAMFSGIVRCIQILDPNTPQQRHCMSMIVNNLSTNETACTRCTKQQMVGVPQPKVINSSMIPLTRQELEEVGLKEDPFAKASPVPDAENKPKKSAKPAEKAKPRRTVMKNPNSIKFEITIEELNSGPSVFQALLQKILAMIYDLPVSNFREAEQIRIVKDKVEAYLKEIEYKETH